VSRHQSNSRMVRPSRSGIYNMAYTLENHAMPAPLLTPSRPKEAKLFRNNRSQAVRIPVEFELPGDRVMIHREGSKLIIEPVTRPTNIVELLAEWRKEAPLGPEDQLLAIPDMPARPEDIF
ncbi:antitoxin, partial [Verminephrobacter eiseniae]|uniref:antitoxin n=1 Tax=Verminephrobacter eiseniae TaxID=364317 RepID=UPI002AA2A3A7